MPGQIAKYNGIAESKELPFPDLLWDMLKPFPGRAQLTLRLAIICTAIVLESYTFRLPFQDLMPFFILFTTKEEKVTTTVSAVLVLVTVTLAIAISILLFKATGNRAEFRIPAIAMEIFVGMYLFRVLAIAPVGWILGFICAASQSLVYLFPDPEETVHQFLWLWVAVAFSVSLAWLANLLLFPVSATRLLQRELADGWDAVAASAQLTTGSASAVESALRPLVKNGPNRFLKLLKLSLIESPGLREKRPQLTRLILGLDKITKLIFSYAYARPNSSSGVAIPSADTAILDELKGQAAFFEGEFQAGRVPSGGATPAATKTADGLPAFQLLEAECTLGDLSDGDTEIKNRPEKVDARQRRSLFVPDAFSNPRHVQFALKVTLAGIIGYLFYTASDYYGIHTVFYTPLIIALASGGATIHKGLLRIVGCIIGGALGLLCTVWIIPRYETLETFLFIVFCVHGLAAWIACGNERISYVGLQVALAFDLGFLHGYGPPTSIDPLRDRLIGIFLGIIIISVIFSLLWPESAGSIARARLAASLRAIARLLQLGDSNPSSPSSIGQREQVELEIASRLSEANSSMEQVTFEALLHGTAGTEQSRLEETSAGVEEIYVASLPWLREQASSRPNSLEVGDPKTTPELISLLVGVTEAFADLIERPGERIAGKAEVTTATMLEIEELRGSGKLSSDSLGDLIRAMRNFQILVQPDGTAQRVT